MSGLNPLNQRVLSLSGLDGTVAEKVYELVVSRTRLMSADNARRPLGAGGCSMSAVMPFWKPSRMRHRVRGLSIRLTRPLAVGIILGFGIRSPGPHSTCNIVGIMLLHLFAADLQPILRSPDAMRSVRESVRVVREERSLFGHW